MKTKIKAFDAVAESRKWREATSRKLDAMSLADRLAYLAGARERYVAERPGIIAAFVDLPGGEEPAAVKPAKAFDAVLESRKWKEAVARETEGMSTAERVAYFRRHSSVERAEFCVVREEPPKP